MNISSFLLKCGNNSLSKINTDIYFLYNYTPYKRKGTRERYLCYLKGEKYNVIYFTSVSKKVCLLFLQTNENESSFSTDYNGYSCFSTQRFTSRLCSFHHPLGHINRLNLQREKAWKREATLRKLIRPLFPLFECSLCLGWIRTWKCSHAAAVKIFWQLHGIVEASANRILAWIYNVCSIAAPSLCAPVQLSRVGLLQHRCGFHWLRLVAL